MYVKKDLLEESVRNALSDIEGKTALNALAMFEGQWQVANVNHIVSAR